MVECFRVVFTIEAELGVFTINFLFLLFSFLFSGDSLFFYSLKIIVTETCSRTSIVDDLSKNGFSFVKKAMLFFFLQGIPFSCLICLPNGSGMSLRETKRFRKQVSWLKFPGEGRSHSLWWAWKRWSCPERNKVSWVLDLLILRTVPQERDFKSEN